MSPLIPEKHSKYPMRIEGNSKLRGSGVPSFQHLNGQNSIQRPGTEARAIKRDVLVTCLAKGRRDRVERLDCESIGQLGARNLYASKIPMVTHAKLSEAKLSDRLLGIFDLLKYFACNRAAVLYPRRKARRRG